jgi:thiol-disulfide isomerase/thioredoxin
MDWVGLVAVVTVLVVGLAVGLWRRRTDGRLVDVRRRRTGSGPGPHPGPGPGPGPGQADGTAVAGTLHAMTSAEAAAVTEERVDDDRLDPAMLERLGVGPAGATLLQFSSAFCAPCRAVRRVSTEVAGLLPGVQHIEVDAESHLDEVRTLNIWRTPTLLVLDGEGRVTRRATGVPTKPQLIAALGEVLPAAG